MVQTHVGQSPNGGAVKRDRSGSRQTFDSVTFTVGSETPTCSAPGKEMWLDRSATQPHFETRDRLKLANDLSVTAATEVLVGVVIDVLADEPHSSITQQELGPTGVTRPESPTQVPVVLGGAGWKRGGRPSVRSSAGRKRVDRDRHRGVGVGHAIEVPPATTMIVAGWENLADHDRVAGAVGEVGKGDSLRQNAAKTSRDFTLVVGTSMT